MQSFNDKMSKRELVEPKEVAICDLVSKFCDEKLNDEYARLCVKMVKKLGRKRECPFVRGRLEIWAAAVIYTVGANNFLFDRNTEPYIPSADLYDYFGVANNTITAKSANIRRLLKMSPRFDNAFATEGTMDMNPFNNFVMIDGMIYAVSELPEEIREEVRDQLRKH